MNSNYLYFFICILSPVICLPVNAGKRTLACDNVCKAIRFPGKIGGCNCNFVMFTKRSSEFRRSLETEVENLEQLRQNLIGSSDSDESTEYENERESKAEQPESTQNLIDIFRRQIMNPYVRDY